MSRRRYVGGFGLRSSVALIVLTAAVVAAACMVTPATSEVAGSGEQAAGGAWLEAAREKIRPERWPSCGGLLTRIAGQVDELSKESVEQTLAKLSQPYMYFWPGAAGDPGHVTSFPFDRDVGRWTLESIKSNRRFLKASQDLSALPRDQATRLVSSQIQASLPVYQTAFVKRLTGFAQSLKEAKVQDPQLRRYAVGFGYQIGNNPDGSPTLYGLRFQVLALVLIAGNLELEGARPAVLAAAEEAVKQRELLYDREQFTDLRELDRYLILKEASLYHRQTLTTGLAGTSADRQTAENLVQAGLGLTWEGTILTTYDAVATRYDTWHLLPLQVEFSRGAVPVRHVSPVSDEEFDRMLRWARSEAGDR